jgi:predicted transcriptional regulator
MIKNITESDNSAILNTWANSINIRRVLMKEDDLYIDELHLLAFILVLGKKKRVGIIDLMEGFNILSYKREQMVEKLTSKGYLRDDRQGKFHNYVLTIAGEQLIMKYKKLMERFCEEA